MKRQFTFLLFAICSIFIASCRDNKQHDKVEEIQKKVNLPEGIGLGMVQESREKLASIPLAIIPTGKGKLPASADLSDKMPEPGDQGEQQSCVGWAVAYALKGYQENVELGEQMNFSPSFIYNQINNGRNEPTRITDALEMLSEKGVCLLDEMPYDEEDWQKKPSQKAIESAKHFRIDYWRQVNVQDIKQVKVQVSAGIPVIIGAEVSYEFAIDGQEQKENYIWKKRGLPTGGHAMVVVGYDDSKNAFKLINSWGTEWGDNGYAWIDYDLFPEVTWYGFIAKDAYTEPGIVQHKKSRNYDTGKDAGKKDVIQPDKISFHSREVIHNVYVKGGEELGKGMMITGTVDLPARFGKKFKIAVHIYDADTREQVKSLMPLYYADEDGFAAKTTRLYDVGENGIRNGTWRINIPYKAIEFYHGKKDFYAIPTLFADEVSVAYGEKINFWMKKP